jgi:hypothetical protein
MAALTITAANVVAGTGALTNRSYNAGEAVTAGQSVYLKAADSKLWLAQADGTAAESTVFGIALHAASANQPLAIQTGGPITIGATILTGVFYYVSPTAGGLCAVADLGSTNYVTPIGYGTSTTVLQVLPIPTLSVLI